MYKRQSQDQGFAVETNTLVGFEDFFGRPPRSAKLVADIDFGSGPGGGDYRTYFLCTDKTRSGWYLWLRLFDEDIGKPKYHMEAYGKPYRGYPAKYAAEQLLTEVLEEQRDDGTWTASPPWYVMKPGLLSTDDIQQIGLNLFGAEYPPNFR